MCAGSLPSGNAGMGDDVGALMSSSIDLSYLLEMPIPVGNRDRGEGLLLTRRCGE
jgi:hypothetical protein